MRGTTNAATLTKWYVMGRWASGDADIHRTSLGGQGDTDGTIAIDTFLSRKGVTLTAYQLRVTLLRLPSLAPDRRSDPPARSRRRCPPTRRSPSPARSARAPASSSPSRATRRTSTRPLPGVRRRRRGVVQPDLDRDGRRVLRATARAGTWAGSTPAARHPTCRPRGPLHLRLPLRGHRQLAVQHGIRRDVRPRRLRHPAAIVGRGRAVHRAPASR